jgi:hypothetical protein
MALIFRIRYSLIIYKLKRNIKIASGLNSVIFKAITYIVFKILISKAKNTRILHKISEIFI